MVISGAHEGLKAAIAQTLAGASWQRCRVHVTLAPDASAGVRTLLAHLPQGDKVRVAAAVCTIFALPSPAAARAPVGQGAQLRD